MDTKKVVGITLVGLVIIGVLGMTVWVVKAYHAPLGPALVPTAIPTDADPVQAQIILTPNPEPTPIPVVEQAGVCGETAVWNVLVLGSDAADLRPPKGSDLTRMLRVDFPNRRVTMFAFSRDLWVDTTGLGLTNPTINATRLGMVFYEARSRSTSANVRD